MELIYLFGILLWLIVAYKWGDWSKFNQYRSTIYIVIIGALLYNALTEGDKLWSFESPTFHLRHIMIAIWVAFIAIPCTITVFLMHYPEKGLLKQILYNLLWAAIYTSHEWIVYKLGVFSYEHGWNLGWSALINMLAFPFVRLHQLKPNFAIIIFLICTSFFCYMFKIPVFEAP